MYMWVRSNSRPPYPCLDLVPQRRVRDWRHVGVRTDEYVTDVETALQVS